MDNAMRRALAAARRLGKSGLLPTDDEVPL
jgi:hypothetical protein